MNRSADRNAGSTVLQAEDQTNTVFNLVFNIKELTVNLVKH